MDKKIMKFVYTEIEKNKFRQHNSPISLNEKDIKEIVVFNKFLFSKQDFRYFIGFRDDKKLGLDVYSSQKRADIEVLIKIIVFIL